MRFPVFVSALVGIADACSVVACGDCGTAPLKPEMLFALRNAEPRMHVGKDR
jgi:hypothetical protein